MVGDSIDDGKLASLRLFPLPRPALDLAFDIPAALGEIAFCTGAPRTATVIADTAAVIRILKRERFDELAKTDPQSALAVQHELLRRLSRRVSSTSAMVRDLLK